VARFLTPAWLDDLDAAARDASVPDDVHLVVQQVVTDGDGDGEVAYVIEIADGALRVRSGRADDAHVTFRQDRATATAIAQGALSAQVAFMDGRLRLGGDLHAVLDRARHLAAIDDVFAAARDATTW